METLTPDDLVQFAEQAVTLAEAMLEGAKQCAEVPLERVDPPKVRHLIYQLKMVQADFQLARMTLEQAIGKFYWILKQVRRIAPDPSDN